MSWASWGGRRPSLRIEPGVSTLSGLSAARCDGRSWKDQSPFLSTKKSFWAWLSVRARITE